jgi:transposase
MTNGASQQSPTQPAEATPAEIDPSNLAAVREFLADMLAQGRHDEALDQVINLLLQVLADNTAKAEHIAKLVKALYGRKSEKISPAQLELFLQQAAAEEAGQAPTDPEADHVDEEAPPPKPEPREQRRPGRNALPANLPRERIVLKVPEALRKCLLCGLDKTCMGHEVSEVLNFRPASLYVEQIEREKLACRPCQEGVVIAPAAHKVIDGGMAGAGLLAHITVSKYLDHQPLYRLVQILSRWGVEMAESTLGSWIAAVSRLLQPLADAIAAKALGCRVLGADDTGMKVLDNDDERGIKRGHIWMYLGYEYGVATWPAFTYTIDWAKTGPAAFLAGRTSGILQCDGYKGWPSLAKNELVGLILAGCWAHSRRKFVEAIEAGIKSAATAVKLIGQLYRIEQQARDDKLDCDARRQLRQLLAVPVLAELKKWKDERIGKTTPKSALGQALGYLHNQWDALQVYVDDGEVPIDNNLVENKIRPIALGRRNYLFCGSDAGAERAATIYTVLATCKLAGVEPWAYLNDVLPRLARLPEGGGVADLLPVAWKAARTAQGALGPGDLTAEAA